MTKRGNNISKNSLYSDQSEVHGFKELTNQKRTSIQNEPIRIGLPKKGTNQQAYSLITGQSEEDIHIEPTNQNRFARKSLPFKGAHPHRTNKLKDHF